MIFRKNKVKRSLPRKIGNGIIGFFVALFFLFLVFIAFSQTSTFREMLRAEIIEIASNSINGKLEIGSIEGTIVTQLKLRNVSLSDEQGTVFSANKIEVAINPFFILAKRLKVTKLNIVDADFSLLEQEKDTWNINRFIKSDSLVIVIEGDSVDISDKKTEFPLLIDISNFSLENISFKMKKNPFLNVAKSYESMNYDDIEITKLNLKLDLLANINTNEYIINISELSFIPNLSNFRLKNLSGDILISESYVELQNLNIITDSSMMRLSARMDELNLFGDVDLFNFKNYPIKFNLLANPIVASDLSTFIEPLNFMNGKTKLSFQGNGKFGDFDFDAKLNLKKTEINFAGKITELHTPSEIYTKATFKNTTVDYKEISSFLSGLDLPKYPELVVENLNLDYEGLPLKFNAKGGASIGKGSFKIDSYMDITRELIEYDFKVETKNLNLKSTLGINSKLNSKGRLSGNGFDPEKSNSFMSFTFTNSNIEGHQIDLADISLHTIDKLVDLRMSSKLNGGENEISGKLDLANTDKPIYNLQGSFNNLNLFNYTKDSTLNSSLNFTFDVSGHSLDLDKTEGEFKLNFVNSTIGQNTFDSISFKIDLSKIENTRVINFQSDILDFNIKGDFLMDETFNLLSYQSSKIAYVMAQKLSEINPVEFTEDTSQTLKMLQSNKVYSEKDIYLDYNFNFKDFKFIAALLNRDQVEISGKGSGYIENNYDNFSISATMDVDWLFLFKGKDVFYISGVESTIDVGVDNNKYSFDNIFGSLSFSSEEMVSDLNINRIQADLIFNQSRAFINAEVNIDDDINTGVEGFFTFADSTETFNISNLYVLYKDYEWKSRDTIQIVNSPHKFRIDNFNLFNSESSLSLNGSLVNKEIQNFDIILSNVKGSHLTKSFIDSDASGITSNINAFAKIRGTTKNPSYKVDFSMENLKVKDNYLGSLLGEVDYLNKNIAVDIEFIDSLNHSGKKLLTLIGNIPMNLDGDEDELEDDDSDRTLNLKLITNGFNLASLGNSIPTILFPKGIVNSEISILGEINDFRLEGYLTASKIKFTSAITNLDYITDLNLVFDDNKISINNSILKNNGKTKFPGQVLLSGDIFLDGFNLSSANLFLNGSLAILSNSSRETLPNFYGDLQIATEKDFNFQYKNNKPSLSGSIVLREVNLNFIPPESSYSVTNSDFKYIFVTDSLTSSIQREKQSRLITALLIKKVKESTNSLANDFDLDMKIMSPNIAKVSVVLSKTLNQKLLADITGDLRIKNINNQFTSQGQFDILPSSMFTFYKTFNAEGNIKFTSELSNPMINITATYISDYINPRDTEAEPVRTAVKIKIDDSAKSILDNIASGTKPLDMQIYSGTQNIDYDVPNPQYTNLDAMYFIVFGTFSTDTENASIAKSAGYSMLGSAFTSALNARLGNLINNVNINQTGKQTRYNISGRFQQFRYTFGGTFEEISDMSQANAKVEYLFSPQFIMRVERKDPVISTSYDTQKINEFGVMYRFTF